MNEKIQITIQNLDDMKNVLTSLELLFSKLIYYYLNKDINKLSIFVLSCSVYFGRILQILGWNNKDFEEDK